jgi:hypothetical protein
MFKVDQNFFVSSGGINEKFHKTITFLSTLSKARAEDSDLDNEAQNRTSQSSELSDFNDDWFRATVVHIRI